MATTQTFAQNQVVPAGTTTWGGPTGFSIPTAGPATVTVDTAGVPAGLTFTLEIDVSTDGGAHFQPWMGPDTFSSDPSFDKLGNPTTRHGDASFWPGGHMRVIVTASASATLSVTATLG